MSSLARVWHVWLKWMQKAMPARGCRCSTQHPPFFQRSRCAKGFSHCSLQHADLLQHPPSFQPPVWKYKQTAAVLSLGRFSGICPNSCDWKTNDAYRCGSDDIKDKQWMDFTLMAKYNTQAVVSPPVCFLPSFRLFGTLLRIFAGLFSLQLVSPSFVWNDSSASLVALGASP